MVDTRAMTIRLPEDLYEHLRQEAFAGRKSMNTLITEGLRLRLADIRPGQYGDLCALFEAAWHHVVPESLDDLAPLTSDAARTLSNLAMDVMSR